MLAGLALKKETKRTAFRMAYASSIGISIVISIFGSLYFGIWLDGKFGTAPYLTMLMLLLGVASGFRNIYVMIRRSLDDEKSTDSADKGDSENRRNGIFSKKD
jgi:ATP synthase protein I